MVSGVSFTFTIKSPQYSVLLFFSLLNLSVISIFFLFETSQLSLNTCSVPLPYKDLPNFTLSSKTSLRLCFIQTSFCPFLTPRQIYMSQIMELIPGLPNEIARECLVRVPYNKFSNIASTCKDWKVEIHSPQFFRHRKAAGCSKHVVVMTQIRVNPNRTSGLKCLAMPVYRLVLCEPDTGDWCELPAVPGLSNGLPMFCQVTGVGSNLVVMGGLDPDTFEVRNAVYVYNFISATWHRGADMPGVRRIFFGCASDLDRMVYVAGGHDGEKNALRSAMAYDAAANTWVSLPDMEKERDECKGIFNLGKFLVIGGYCTDRQGQFESGAEQFDIATWQWNPAHENLPTTGMSPRTCVAADGKLYTCQGGDVATLVGDTWKVVAELPAEVYNTAHVVTWQDKLLLIGSPSFGEPHSAYVLNLGNYTWTKLEVADEYSGHVQSGCYLEL